MYEENINLRIINQAIIKCNKYIPVNMLSTNL